MEILHLAWRNILRHPLRSILTAAGIAVALFAFCMIRTMIAAWFSGVEGSAKNRLVTRNAASLIFYLPRSYAAAIERTPGVEKVGFGNWFGGRYKEEEFRFAQFAVDENYLEIYPEYVLSEAERAAYREDKKGAIVGEAIANDYNIKVGDVVQLQGTIFPALWEFNVRGVFRGRDDSTDTKIMFFHWDYLNERNRAEFQRQPDNVGFYVIQVAPNANPAVVSKAIDANFQNSFAESLTETETAFQQSFVSMSSAIILALDIISGVVIGIMLLVLTNTMLMASRERYREYAILKALGFGRKRLAALLISESVILTGTALIVVGTVLAFVFSLPPKQVLGQLNSFFPVFVLPPRVALGAALLAIVVALASALFPILAVTRMPVADGLRRVH